MTATTWLIIAITAFALAGITFIAAVFMFFCMNIPAVVGDLSGKTVAREIKAMRAARDSDEQSLKPSRLSVARGAVTEKVQGTVLDAVAQKQAYASRRLDADTNKLAAAGPDPDSRDTASLEAAASQFEEDSCPTEVLSSNAELYAAGAPGLAAGVLTGAPTEKLLFTEVLAPAIGLDTPESPATTLLAPTEELVAETAAPVAFAVVRSEVVVHSDGLQ